MNPRHSGRRYSDLIYKMAAVVGMSAAVGMAALITAWVAGDAKAAGVPTATVSVGPVTICIDGACTTQKDPQSTSATQPPPNVAGVLACAYGEVSGTTGGCVAVPVAPTFGYTPPGWPSPAGPTSPLTGQASDPTRPGQCYVIWAFAAPDNGARVTPIGGLAGVCAALKERWCSTHTLSTCNQYSCDFTCALGGQFILSACNGAGCTPTTSTPFGAFGGKTCTTGEEPLVSNPSNVCTPAFVLPDGYNKSAATGQSGAVVNNNATYPRPADGKCNVVRTGNAYSADAADPDCAVATLATAGITVGASSVTARATDGPKTTTAKVDATAAGTTATATSEDSDTTRVESRIVTIGPGGAGGGAVTGSGHITGTGSGVGVVNDQNVNVKEGGGSSGEIEFPELPTDYNREATQQAILAELTAAPADLDGAVDSLDAATDERISAFDGATGAHGITLSFSPILPTPSCSFPTFSVAGHSLDMSSWCPRLEILRQLIGLALYVGTAFALYDIFTRSTGA